MTFTFRCRKPNGDEVIQNFLDRAYAYYQDELKKQQDNSRYFYCMVSTSSSGERPIYIPNSVTETRI